MKPKFFSAIAALALFLSACSSNTPAANSNGQNPTAVEVGPTETQPVIPTATAVPSTLEPSPTLPAPTNTAETSPTLAPTEIPPTSTATAGPVSSGKTDCNQPLLSWTVPTSTLTVYDETKTGAKNIIVLVSVITAKGECGWLKIYGSTFTGPVGMYSATAFVEGRKKNFTVSGNFQIQEGAWKVVVRDTTIVALGGCYPNC